MEKLKPWGEIRLLKGRLAIVTPTYNVVLANFATGGDSDLKAGDELFLAAGDALAAPPWRPMETAPKDGTEILLKVERRAGVPGCRLVGHYMAGGHCIEDHPPINEGWYFWDGGVFDKAATPVAWLPLP